MLRNLSRQTLQEEAQKTLKEFISKMEVGDRLPPENQLVKELGISRPTVREALILLQAEGFIEIKRGIGAFVIDNDEYRKGKFIEWFQNNKFQIKELIEVRLAIEPFIGKLAAKRISEKELSKLKLNYEETKKVLNRTEVNNNLVELDEEFHQLIVTASRNNGLKFMYDNYIPSFREYRSRALLPPANSQLVLRAHKKILDALIEGDPDKVYQAISNHILESESDIENTAQSLVDLKDKSKKNH